MREKNKEIVSRIEEAVKAAWVKTDGDIINQVEIVLEYKSRGGQLEHQIAHYWINGNGHVMGTIGSVFDFDFYGIREIVDFWVFDKMKR
jgi:hypothetical protein